MSYIKEIGFRESFNRKYVLQVLVQTKDKDYDTVRRWKDADVHDLLEAAYQGFIKGNSVYSNEEEDKDIESPKFDKPDKDIRTPKFDVKPEDGSSK